MFSLIIVAGLLLVVVVVVVGGDEICAKTLLLLLPVAEVADRADIIVLDDRKVGANDRRDSGSILDDCARTLELLMNKIIK